MIFNLIFNKIPGKTSQTSLYLCWADRLSIPVNIAQLDHEPIHDESNVQKQTRMLLHLPQLTHYTINIRSHWILITSHSVIWWLWLYNYAASM